MIPSRPLLPLVVCAIPLACTLARSEVQPDPGPVHFTLGYDRALASDDGAQGEFVAGGKRTVLRHADVVIDKVWNEDAPSLKLRLSDVPLRTRSVHQLEDMARAGHARFIEARLDDRGRLAFVLLCNQDLKPICVKMVERGERPTKLELDLREGHQLRGRLYTTGSNSFMDVPYSFTAAFKATLWETPGDHLAATPDGRFGVAPGRATGTASHGQESMSFAHAYARSHRDGIEVALTPRALSDWALEHPSGFDVSLDESGTPALQLLFRANGTLESAYWKKKPRDFDTSDREARKGEIYLFEGDDVRFNRGPAGAGTVAGTVYSTVPVYIRDKPCEFKVTFAARVPGPS